MWNGFECLRKVEEYQDCAEASVQRLGDRVETFEKIGGYFSFFKEVSLYIILNKAVPDYARLKLRVADHDLIQLLAEVTGTNVAKLMRELQAKGDIGFLAEIILNLR